jgi:outer membrane protein OmpA-like peptidoglycan-associated protein
VRDGSAKGCSLKGDELSVKSAGTCLVSAKRSARGSTPAVSSKTITIRFSALSSSAHTLTVVFGAGASALTSASKRALTKFAAALKSTDTVVSTGYAKGNRALALRRATSVARYLKILGVMHVIVRSVSNAANNKAIVST